MPFLTLDAACDVLEIDVVSRSNLTPVLVKKQYRKCALKYHPDKNPSPHAVSEFQRIQEANEYLIERLRLRGAGAGGDGDSDSDSDDGEFAAPSSYYTEQNGHSYKSLFIRVVRGLFERKNGKLILVFTKLAGLCETAALEYLRKIERPILSKIYEVAKQHNDVFRFSDEFLESIREILEEREDGVETIILNPHLDDLWDDQLYKLTHHGRVFFVPLWHTELVYDISGNDFNVKCCPLLPENIELDENNNIDVELHYPISDLWEKDRMEVKIGRKTFYFLPKQLRLTAFQSVVMKGEGISAIKSKNIYDVSQRRDVILHIHLYV